jgi:hypothetical protein
MNAKVTRHTDLEVYKKAFKANDIYQEYENLTRMLLTMINNPAPWLLKGKQ